MKLDLLIENAALHYNKKTPFVMYALPNSTTITGLFQTSDTPHTIEKLQENGFVFAPFDYMNNALFIPESHSEVIAAEFQSAEMEYDPISLPESKKEKTRYIQLVEKAICAIKKRKVKKIVISRKREFPLNDFSIENLINRIFSSYPSAFRYIWYNPNTGIWTGATPETLVQVENNSFTTMALAGTQPYKKTGRTFWGNKELNEQQLVTDAITNSLQRVTSVLKVTNPYTHRAGSLVHLRTDVTGILKTGKANLTTITSALHPTPAVCGTPQKAAKEFILENEDYDRTYYTGFMGPILLNGDSASIMVNLRCMKIEDNIATIYVGGGITSDSYSQDEWKETENKMQTMLQVLRPML